MEYLEEAEEDLELQEELTGEDTQDSDAADQEEPSATP
jgi:hypothetical protein